MIRSITITTFPEVSLRFSPISVKPGAFANVIRYLGSAIEGSFKVGGRSPWEPLRVRYESLHALIIALRSLPNVEYMIVNEAGEVMLWR